MTVIKDGAIEGNAVKIIVDGMVYPADSEGEEGPTAFIFPSVAGAFENDPAWTNENNALADDGNVCSVTSSSLSLQLGVYLTTDGNLTASTLKNTDNFSTVTTQDMTLGGADDLWGYAFSPDDFNSSEDTLGIIITTDDELSVGFGFDNGVFDIPTAATITGVEVKLGDTIGDTLPLGLGVEFRFDYIQIRVHYTI